MPNRFAQTLKLLILQDERIEKKRDGALNVSAAARAMGIQQPTLKRWLDGDNKSQNPDNLQKAASYFRISLDQLLGREPLPSAGGQFRPALAPPPSHLPTLQQTIADLYRQDAELQHMFVAMYWAAKTVRGKQSLVYEGEAPIDSKQSRTKTLQTTE